MMSVGHKVAVLFKGGGALLLFSDDFTAGIGSWSKAGAQGTLSVVGGVAQITGVTDFTSSGLRTWTGLEVGYQYRYTLDLDTGGAADFLQVVDDNFNALQSTTETTSSLTAKSYTFTATTSNAYLFITPYGGSAGQVVRWDNVKLYRIAAPTGTGDISIRGDSTAAGNGGGATTTWWQLMYGDTSPPRPIYNIGTDGESSAQMLARAQADTTHRNWTTILVDRPNAGETAAGWIANVKATAATLTTSRWFVMTPATDSPGGGAGFDTALIQAVQALLLSDPAFSGHSLGATAQANYLAAVNDDTKRGADFIHFNTVGQASQHTYIQAFLTSAGW